MKLWDVLLFSDKVKPSHDQPSLTRRGKKHSVMTAPITSLHRVLHFCSVIVPQRKWHCNAIVSLSVSESWQPQLKIPLPVICLHEAHSLSISRFPIYPVCRHGFNPFFLSSLLPPLRETQNRYHAVKHPSDSQSFYGETEMTSCPSLDHNIFNVSSLDHNIFNVSFASI